MSGQRAILGLAGVCLIVLVLSIAGLVADFSSHLEFNIDGLLLLGVCLMMGGTFAVMLLLIAKEYGWLGRLPLHRKRSTAEVAANPTDSTAGKGK